MPLTEPTYVIIPEKSRPTVKAQIRTAADKTFCDIFIFGDDRLTKIPGNKFLSLKCCLLVLLC